ncbi:MAG: HD domain-containing protein [Planctomycetes bacterium]|nr:HD domain-containing protein [Planctomycetota bacterium]
MADPSKQLYNNECRDAVHGFVYLSDAEWAVVDCPTFQRLRDIRQLAMAHLVYPGATHTRFEHSLGCVHLSDLIFKAVERRFRQGDCPDSAEAFRKSDEKWTRGRTILRLASLLHDLGHSPFSHSGESLMPKEVVDGRKRRLQHEDMTARLIRGTEIADRLKTRFGEEIIEEVIAVATKPESARLSKESDRAWYRFLNDILAGELGSDRMDYLLRDAVHSGQSVGLFDHRKLIDSMTIVPPPEETGEEHRLGLDGAGWLIGEQMVAARYLMYVALYFHKTKRIYEIHLEEFLASWLEARYGRPHFPADSPGEYAKLTDSQVWAGIYEAAVGADEELRRLALPFVDRSHLRLAHELLLADNHDPTASSDDVKAVLDEFARGLQPVLEPDHKGESVADVMTDLQHRLGPILRRRRPRIWNASRFDKLVHSVHNHVREMLDIRSDQTKHSAAKLFGPRDKIWVYLDGKTRYLDELSEIVSGMPDRIWRGRIYAPAKMRDEVRKFCVQWLESNPSGGGTKNV